MKSVLFNKGGRATTIEGSRAKQTTTTTVNSIAHYVI